jgi:hypothetical protein
VVKDNQLVICPGLNIFSLFLSFADRLTIQSWIHECLLVGFISTFIELNSVLISDLKMVAKDQVDSQRRFSISRIVYLAPHVLAPLLDQRNESESYFPLCGIWILV